MFTLSHLKLRTVFGVLAFMTGSLLGQTPRDFFDALIGPTTPEQRLAGEKYQTAEFECRRSLESSPRTAITPCEEAVVISSQLAPQRLIERSSALAMLGRAFFVNGKLADALLKTEEAVEIRSQGSAGRDDEGVATLFENLGIIHFSMANFPKASESMETSIRSYEGAIEKVPSLKTSYTQRLQATIRRYADMKKARGDVIAAESLSRRADSLTTAATLPANPIEEFRMLDGVRLMGLTGARLTEEDLKKIRALMPNSAPPIWLIIGNRVGTYGALRWDIEVYLQPDFSSPRLRVGRVVTVSTELPSADQFSASKTWAQRIVTGRWGQVPSEGRDPQEIRSERDLDRPFQIIEFGDPEKFTNEEVLRLITFVRTEAANTPNADRPRLSTDVQPWGIQSLMRWTPTEAETILINPRNPGSQSVRMRFNSDGVSVLQMR